MKSKTQLVIVGACLAGILWTTAASHQRADMSKVTYSQFLGQVRSGDVDRVVITEGPGAEYRLKDGRLGFAVLPADFRDALVMMQDNKVNVEIADRKLASKAAPFLLLLAVWIVLLLIRRFPPYGSGRDVLIA